MQTLSTLPTGFAGSNTCAEVQIHPNGRFVWVSNRGHDSLAGFRVDAATGRLAALGHTATPPTPRSFTLDPAGAHLYAAGQGSTRLQAYRVDPKTGALTPGPAYEVGRQPSWVLAVTLR